MTASGVSLVVKAIVWVLADILGRPRLCPKVVTGSAPMLTAVPEG